MTSTFSFDELAFVRMYTFFSNSRLTFTFRDKLLNVCEKNITKVVFVIFFLRLPLAKPTEVKIGLRY